MSDSSVVLSGSSLIRKDGFLSFQTSKYRLHYYETPSGLKFVLNTDLSVSNARDALQHIYSNVRRSLSSPCRSAAFSEWFGLGSLSPWWRKQGSDRLSAFCLSCMWSTSWRTRWASQLTAWTANCSAADWRPSSNRCPTTAHELLEARTHTRVGFCSANAILMCRNVNNLTVMKLVNN